VREKTEPSASSDESEFDAEIDEDAPITLG
jgi:hypothetical protein